MSIETFTPAELEAFERVMRRCPQERFLRLRREDVPDRLPRPTVPGLTGTSGPFAMRLSVWPAGEIKRLIILVPPRSLKSICASVALPAWFLGTRSDTKDYLRQLLGRPRRQARARLPGRDEGAWYQSLFPSTRSIQPSPQRPSS